MCFVGRRRPHTPSPAPSMSASLWIQRNSARQRGIRGNDCPARPRPGLVTHFAGNVGHVTAVTSLSAAASRDLECTATPRGPCTRSLNEDSSPLECGGAADRRDGLAEDNGAVTSASSSAQFLLLPQGVRGRVSVNWGGDTLSSARIIRQRRALSSSSPPPPSHTWPPPASHHTVKTVPCIPRGLK